MISSLSLQRFHRPTSSEPLPLQRQLERLARPFGDPRPSASKKLDVASMPKGALKDALQAAASAARAGGENGYVSGAFALYGEGRPQTGKPLGYVVTGFGGTQTEAWSRSVYLDASGQRLGSLEETA